MRLRIICLFRCYQQKLQICDGKVVFYHNLANVPDLFVHDLGSYLITCFINLELV